MFSSSSVALPMGWSSLAMTEGIVGLFHTQREIIWCVQDSGNGSNLFDGGFLLAAVGDHRRNLLQDLDETRVSTYVPFGEENEIAISWELSQQGYMIFSMTRYYVSPRVMDQKAYGALSGMDNQV